MAEGRELFLKALQLRFHHRYEEAALAFEAAVDAGSADACWHMFCHHEYGGNCQLDKDVDTLALLAKGRKLGHVLCTVVHYVLTWEDDQAGGDVIDDVHWTMLPVRPTLEAEVFLWGMLPDHQTRVFSADEVNVLKDNAYRALQIHDNLAACTYLQYVLEYDPDRLRFVDPKLIGQILFLHDCDGAAALQYRRRNGLYTDFGRHSFDLDDFGLHENALSVIQCVVGELAHHVCSDIGEYVEERQVYKTYQARAQCAAVAWLGCFRRKALPYLNRDMATLIAKSIAPAVQWAECDPHPAKPGGGRKRTKYE